jgi:hypothetical protein
MFSSPRCLFLITFGITDHKRMVSTMVCGPFGGVYPYPSHGRALESSVGTSRYMALHADVSGLRPGIADF